MKLNRDFFKIAAILLGAALLVILFFSILSKWEHKQGAVDISDSDMQDDGRLYLNGQCYAPNEDLDVTLLIGVDKYESQTQGESYNNNQQADFLMLLVMDRENESYTVLHLNRDTMTEIPVLGVRGEKAGTITGQLALAHTYGSGRLDSCRNTAEAVSNLLYGIEIDHYIAVTMDAVAQINDLVGGVTVTVLDDLTSVSPELTQGATVTLTGDMALAYVRTRYGLDDSSNLQRMERQRQYLSALGEILSTKADSDETFFVELLEAISEYMTSDCTANQLSLLSDRFSVYGDRGFLTVEGEAVVGDEFIEFYPDEEALKQLVINLFYVPVDEE